MHFVTWQAAVTGLILTVGWCAPVGAQAQTNAPVDIDSVSSDAEIDIAPAPAPQRAQDLEPPITLNTPTAAPPRVELRPAPEPASDDREQWPLGRDPSPGDTADNKPDVPGDSWILETFSALVIVIALIFAVRMLLRRMSGQGGAGDSGGLVEVLARSTIAPKTQVLFLKVQQRILLVAQGPAGVQPLANIDDPQEIAQLLTAIDAGKSNSITRGFRQLMSRMDRAYESPEETAGADQSEHSIDRANEQVSGLLGRLRRMNSEKD